MPGDDAGYQLKPGQPDLYPPDQEGHAALVSWCQRAFTAAEAHRRPKEEKWRKYHRIYRSYVDKSQAPSWKSAAFIPYAFSIVEGIAPKMVAQLPSFVCYPVGPEDVMPAKLMESELQRDAEQTILYVPLIKAIKTSLKFGTGILKNYYRQDIRKAYEQRPVMQDVQVPMPMMGAEVPVNMDGQAEPQTQMTTEQQPVIGPDGQPMMEWVPYEFIAYEGPASVWIDPFNFYVAPEATDLDDARYVIHKITDKSRDYIREKVMQGVYRLPPGVDDVDEMWSQDEDGQSQRADAVGETQPNQLDDTRHPTELLEFWTDDNRVITMLNRQHVIRVMENPFWHGEKPFCHFPDYLQEGEFWGVGEVEAIEGLQDLENAIINQRIDNLRLTMDAMFAVNEKAMEDERDLVIRPGGVIRIAGDYMPQEAIQRIDLGDVTQNAFVEASEIERLMERVSGMSAYQSGMDSSSMNRTATGVSLITEAGNSKFALKVRLMELVGLKRLARQWGAIIQQFSEEERTVRIQGPAGQWLFPTLTPDSIQGALDYSIDVESSTQTESVRKEQALSLLQTIAGVYPVAVPKLVQDVLESFGVKDLTPYMMGTPDLMMMTQMMQAQQSGGVIIPFPQQGQPGQGQPGQGQPQGQPGQPGQPQPAGAGQSTQGGGATSGSY